MQGLGVAPEGSELLRIDVGVLGFGLLVWGLGFCALGLGSNDTPDQDPQSTAALDLGKP